MIVPAYFYPGTGGPGGLGDGWAAMTVAAASVPVTAIFNPNSGPLPGPPDPNYANAMRNLQNAGGHVVAYIYTDYGKIPHVTVEAEVSTYIAQYGGLIDGFFIDGMAVETGTLSYYQQLDDYIGRLDPSHTVIGNPAHPYLNGVSPADYLSTADVFNIFEGPNAGSLGFDEYPSGVNWFRNYPSDRFSNIVFAVPAVALPVDIVKAVQLNAGSVNLTDQTGSNPYHQLPSYWDQEVSLVAGITPVAEPSTLPLLLLGGLVTFGMVARSAPRCRGGEC